MSNPYPSFTEAIESAAKDGGVMYVSITQDGFIKTRKRPAKITCVRVTENQGWEETATADGVVRNLIWNGVK